MTTLIEEMARAMHPHVSGHKDWPEWDATADWYRGGICKQAQAALSVILKRLRGYDYRLIEKMQIASEEYFRNADNWQGRWKEVLNAIADHLEQDK